LGKGGKTQSIRVWFHRELQISVEIGLLSAETRSVLHKKKKRVSFKKECNFRSEIGVL